MSDVQVGDRVQVVSQGEQITPPEWVGRVGKVVFIGDRGSFPIRVLLDGDAVPMLLGDVELVPEQAAGTASP